MSHPCRWSDNSLAFTKHIRTHRRGPSRDSRLSAIFLHHALSFLQLLAQLLDFISLVELAYLQRRIAVPFDLLLELKDLFCILVFYCLLDVLRQVSAQGDDETSISPR